MLFIPIIVFSLISAVYSACTFHNGWTVTRTTSNQVLCTNSAHNTLVFQPDGNLVIYTSANKALWATNTVGTTNMGQQVVFTSGGSLVVNTGSNRAVFNTNTAASSGTLVFQDDTNFVIYNIGGSAVWNSRTQVTCDCSYNYFWGGCSVNRATSDGQCCKCALHGVTCSGTPTSASCAVGCASYDCCVRGGGSCGGYAASPVGSK